VIIEDSLQEEKEKIIESELKGLTLRIYWHILSLNKKETIGIRSVQRALNLSSPSVASHHLEKLKDLGLLEKEPTGEYRLVNQVKVGVLRNFVGVLGVMLPRYLFYSTMFTAMLVLYPILYPPNFSAHNLMAFVFGISAVVVSWNETFRVWRMRPF
jgi:DNA-binding transcriptional ArsR family regulator